MKIQVHKPAGFLANANDAITVSVKQGSAKLFSTSTRVGFGSKSVTFTAASFVNANNEPVASVDYWVEIFEPNAALRNIQIELKYGAATNTVAATGIWVDFNSNNGFHNTGKTGTAPAADNPDYKASFKVYQNDPANFELGLPAKPFPFTFRNKATGAVTFYRKAFRNMVEMEFITMPANIGKEPDIKFDLSRSLEGGVFSMAQGKQKYQLEPGSSRAFPPFREMANDDGFKRDEDNEPTNDRIYSLDFPGPNLDITLPLGGVLPPDADISNGWSRYAQRANFQEFARVLVSRADFKHEAKYADQTPEQQQGNMPPVQGSRASELINWRSWLDFTWDGKAWVRTPNVGGNVYNEITLGAPRVLTQPAT